MNNTKPRTLSLSQRGMNFETLMWLFTRLSALGIYALIIVGLIGALIMGARNQMNFAEVIRWAFNPNLHHVLGTNVADLTPWEGPFWELTASALLLLCVTHGVHGLVVIADDYMVSARGRQIARLLSIVAVLLGSVVGLYMIWFT